MNDRVYKKMEDKEKENDVPGFLENNPEYESLIDKNDKENKTENIPVHKVKTSDSELHPSEVFYEFYRPIQHGSLREAVCCMICVTLGTGMLPLPYFFRTNGILLTLIIFTICGLSTYYTLQKLIKMAHNKNTFSYSDLVKLYFGKGMTIYSIVVLLINSFGSIILWNVYIKVFLKDILNYFNPKIDTQLNTIYMLLLVLIVIEIPLSLFNGPRLFDIMSILGIIQIAYVLIILFIEFPGYASNNFSFEKMSKKGIYFKFNFKIIEMPFVFFTSFGNHSTILSAVNQVEEKTETKCLNVGKRTYWGEYFIYVAVLFISFFSTFEDTAEIFLNRPNLSLLMMIGECNMAILMICNISLYYFTTMPTLEYLFNNSKPFEGKSIYLVSFTVLSVLMFVTFFIDHVTTILDFLGIFAQVSLIFILPICLEMKINQTELTACQKIKNVFMIIFFTLLGLGGFIAVLAMKF
ncbi:MAG: amino acid transporter [archaeon]|nr:amino acid transporter [archaeon]